MSAKKKAARRKTDPLCQQPEDSLRVRAMKDLEELADMLAERGYVVQEVRVRETLAEAAVEGFIKVRLDYLSEMDKPL